MMLLPLLMFMMIQLLDDTHEYGACVALRVLFYVFNLNEFQVTDCSHAVRFGFFFFILYWIQRVNIKVNNMIRCNGKNTEEEYRIFWWIGEQDVWRECEIKNKE